MTTGCGLLWLVAARAPSLGPAAAGSSPHRSLVVFVVVVGRWRVLTVARLPLRVRHLS
jgi:hypothetical protein